MKIRLADLPGAIVELNNLTAGVLPGELLPLDAPALIESNIYQAMQGITILDASGIGMEGITVAGIQLLAQMAGGAAPNLRAIDLSNNNLREHGVAVAAHLAGSETIHTVNMRWNNLGEHGVAVAAHLAGSETIHTVNMSLNILGVHGVAVAAHLAGSEIIHTVNMSLNHLGRHGVAVAALLAESGTIHTVDMSTNNLGEYGIAAAELLAGSETMHTVNMSHNNLGEHGVAVATHFAESRSIQHITLLEQNDAIIQVIAEHNRIVQERAAVSDALEGVVSGAGFVTDVIQLVGQATGDDFDNIIVLE